MSRRVDPVLDQLMTLLEKVANARRPAPTNDELAVAMGYSSSAAASDWVRRLERLGRIRVSRFNHGREITIVATGATTSFEGSRAPHWREQRDAAPVRPKPKPRNTVAAPIAAEELPPRIDRDPCFRCGTRADLGCAHQAPSQPWEAPRG